jgi:hypothetical protein
MSALREEFVERVRVAIERLGCSPASTDDARFVADHLLPFVQAQVDAALRDNGRDYQTAKNDAAIACQERVYAAVKAERERDGYKQDAFKSDMARHSTGAKLQAAEQHIAELLGLLREVHECLSAWAELGGVGEGDAMTDLLRRIEEVLK